MQQQARRAQRLGLQDKQKKEPKMDEKWLKQLVDREKSKEAGYEAAIRQELLDNGEGTFKFEKRKRRRRRRSEGRRGGKQLHMLTDDQPAAKRALGDAPIHQGDASHHLPQPEPKLVWKKNRRELQLRVDARKKRRANRLGERWVPPDDKLETVLETERVAAESVPKVMEVESDSSDDELSSDEEDSEPTNPTLSSLSLDSQSTQYTGLEQPTLDSGAPVTGKSKKRHRVENKWKRRAKQMAQGMAGLAAVASKSYGVSYWAKHQGLYKVPTPKAAPPSYRGQMCPQNVALDHPAANILKSYSQQGCPVNTGKKWTMEMWEAMIEKGPHISALEPDAIQQLQEEVESKVKAKQCKVVEWEWLKSQPREMWEQLKISPIAMVPHKLRKYRAILD